MGKKEKAKATKARRTLKETDRQTNTIKKTNETEKTANAREAKEAAGDKHKHFEI